LGSQPLHRCSRAFLAAARPPQASAVWQHGVSAACRSPLFAAHFGAFPSEKSIAVAQVVPYALDASEQWTNISDNEWAEMHLFKEVSLLSFPAFAIFAVSR
jgi:hypothetical protein